MHPPIHPSPHPLARLQGLVFLQARCEASETEVQRLQQRLHAASSDRTAELEHVQQLNRSLKAEIAALHNRLSGFADIDDHQGLQSNGRDGAQHLESFGSCVLPDQISGMAQGLHGGNGMPFLPVQRLAPIPEGDGSVSAQTSMQGDEVLQEGGLQLVPELQSQVRALAASLHDKTREAEALHMAVERFRNEVGAALLLDLLGHQTLWLVECCSLPVETVVDW